MSLGVSFKAFCDGSTSKSADIMQWASLMLLLPFLPCHDGLYPSGTVSQNKPFLPTGHFFWGT